MGENDEIKSQAVVDVLDYGPLKISGNFILKDLRRDQEIRVNEVFLCRCGRSGTKPYCDGSHKA